MQTIAVSYTHLFSRYPCSKNESRITSLNVSRTSLKLFPVIFLKLIKITGYFPQWMEKIVLFHLKIFRLCFINKLQSFVWLEDIRPFSGCRKAFSIYKFIVFPKPLGAVIRITRNILFIPFKKSCMRSDLSTKQCDSKISLNSGLGNTHILFVATCNKT